MLLVSVLYNNVIFCSACFLTVRVPVPDVDRGRGDARNILAVVTETTSDGFYRLGLKEGLLKQLYSRNQFTVCQKTFLTIEDVPQDKEISLRSVAKEQSLGTGQGFFKCNCKTRCKSAKCACIKNNVLCNSKCHSALSCLNK